MIRIIKAGAFITTPGMNEYDEILSEMDQQKGAKVSRTMYGAVDSNPEQESALVKISRRSGVPVEALRLDDGAEARRRVAAKEAENLLQVAPTTANFLSSPDNARLAHDDVEALAQLERVARQGFGQQMQGGSTLGIATAADQRAAVRAKSIGSAFVEGLTAAPERVSQGLATIPVMAADVVNWSLQAFPDETGMRKRFADTLRGSADYWKKAGDAKLTKAAPQSAESYFQQAGTSIGTSLLAAPFGMAGEDAALGAFALFADGGYQEMRDKGTSVPMAAVLSVSNSAMEGLTEKIGLDALYKGSAPVLKKAIGFVLGDLAGEEINTLYNAVVDKVTIKPDMTMGDVVQQVIDTAIVTSIAGPAQGVSMSGAAKASETLFSQFQAQQEARRQSDFLLALGDSAKATKTFKRLPSAVQDLVRQIKEEGGAVHDVYVPVERFTELFQSQGMDPQQAADQILSDPKRYNEAVATGGDVAIPLEEFARLADAPFYGELVKDSRTSLAGMTAREAEALGAGDESLLNELLQMAAEADPLLEGEGGQTAYQKIYDDTYGQLIGINVAPGEAEANATIRARGLSTLAQRYGYDVDALLAQFPLTVTRGDLPAALQRQPSFTEQQQGAQLSAMLDRIRSGKGASPSEMFGPSLGEFLREKGVKDDRGDLASMDVDKGIKFKKKMLRKGGLSLDKAREAAVEAGYLPEGSDINALLDAVGNELKGQPVYSPGNINQALVDQQDSHNELAQWLDMMGVDLEATGNDEILKLMQEAATGDVLFQSAWHGSPHTFDKFRLQHIGTGEGAQAYGWGLYFASNKAIAESYRDVLSNKLNQMRINNDALGETFVDAYPELFVELTEILHLNGKTKNGMYDSVGAHLRGAIEGDSYSIEKIGQEIVSKMESFIAEYKVKGRLYQVELAPKEEEYLLWDKPLSEQSEVVRVSVGRAIAEKVQPQINRLKDVLVSSPLLGLPTDGRELYQRIAEAEGQQAASEYLHSLGIRGVKYLDGTSRDKGEGNYNYVIFSDEDVEITQMFQAKGTKRGYIKFGDGLPGFEIALLKDADTSTFVHELGHYYEVLLGRLAAQEGAPEQLKADHQALRTWAGAEGDAPLTVEQQEKIARGFEAYLYEGNAPSQEMRGVFQRFKTWLKAVYTSLKNLNVELTDDVRGVFDRLLATDEEIAAAEREQNVKPIFTTAEEAGMSAAVFEAYRKLAEQAHEDAKDRLERAKLKEAARAHKAWWKEAREKMQAEVEAEAKENPVYEALHFLYSGKLFDGSVFEGESFKLSGAELTKLYDAATVKAMRKKLGDVYRKEGGISPAVVAEMFGFSSADEMVKRMMEAPKLKDFIKAETERRMEEIHGKMTGAEIAEEAISAVHNDDQAKLLREELKAIRRKAREVKPFVKGARADAKAELDREKAEREYERRWMEGERKLAVLIERGAKQAEIDDLKASIKADKERARAARKFAKSTIPPVKFFREAARRHVAGLKVSEILPGKYSRAEAKAAKEAFELNGKGEYAEAAAAKQRQLLNHYLYREAMEARAEADKIAAYMRGLAEGKKQKQIGKAGQDYLDQVNALLDQYEFRRRTEAELAERERLIDWVERKEKQNGFPPPIPPSVLEEAMQVNYRSLSMEQLRDVGDAAKVIVFLAQAEGKLLKGDLASEIAQVVEIGVANIEANAKGKKKRNIEKNLPQDKPGKLARNYLAGLRTMSSLAREMDGHVDGGVIWNMLVRPLNVAGDKEAVMQSTAADTANEIFSVYSGAERLKMGTRRLVPGTDLSLSHWGRLMTALNMGNEGNLQRLQNTFTVEEIRAILDTLDERDLQFVQSVWNWIGSFKEEIGAQHKRIHGIEPAWVEPTPLPTKHGILQGGYFPLFYDLDESERAAAQDEAAIHKQMMGGAFTRAMTKDGHTIQRLDKVGRKLDLDISNVFSHVNQVIHDLTHHETLIDLNRMLAKEDLQDAMRDYYGPEAFKVFRDGITDVAVGGLHAKNAFERMSQYVRTGATTAALGWKVTTSMLQPLGLTQSMVRIGPAWVVKGVVRWAASDKSMVGVAREIYEKSAFMRERSKSMNRELAEVNSKIEPGIIPDVIRDSFFYLIQETQKVVDIPTWLGQYEKSMAEHGNEADAIAEADQAVIDSQAHGQMKDLARLHRGGPMMKIFTMFSSYFVRTWNLAAERFNATNFKSPAEAGKFTVDMMMLYVVPAALQTLIFDYAIQILIGGDPDEDALVSKILSGILGSIVAPFPGLKELAAASASIAGYQGPAGTRFYSEVGNLVKQIKQGEADAAFWKALANTAGIVTRAPSGQIVKTVEGMKELADGRGNLLSLLFGKPKH